MPLSAVDVAKVSKQFTTTPSLQLSAHQITVAPQQAYQTAHPRNTCITHLDLHALPTLLWRADKRPERYITTMLIDKVQGGILRWTGHCHPPNAGALVTSKCSQSRLRRPAGRPHVSSSTASCTDGNETSSLTWWFFWWPPLHAYASCPAGSCRAQCPAPVAPSQHQNVYAAHTGKPPSGKYPAISIAFVPC